MDVVQEVCEEDTRFMMRHLWSIMKIKWQDNVTNIKGEDLLIRKNFRVTGHMFSSRSYQKDNDHVTAPVSATKTQSRKI